MEAPAPYPIREPVDIDAPFLDDIEEEEDDCEEDDDDDDVDLDD